MSEDVIEETQIDAYLQAEAAIAKCMGRRARETLHNPRVYDAAKSSVERRIGISLDHLHQNEDCFLWTPEVHSKRDALIEATAQRAEDSWQPNGFAAGCGLLVQLFSNQYERFHEVITRELKRTGKVVSLAQEDIKNGSPLYLADAITRVFRAPEVYIKSSFQLRRKLQEISHAGRFCYRHKRRVRDVCAGFDAAVVRADAAYFFGSR